MPVVLLIEDEPVFAATVARYLEGEGYEVVVRDNGSDGLAAFHSQPPECVLLDLRLPDMDGFEVCRQMREESHTPIIILSSRSDETDKVLGLELGADDYATKSTSPRELLARIRAVTRRAAASAADKDDGPQVLTAHGYTLDRLARTVSDDEGTEYQLAQLEFELLALLMDNAGVALERETIFNRVWQQEGLGSSRTIDTHVVSLRNKLPNLTVSTIRGVGYRLDSEAT